MKYCVSLQSNLIQPLFNGKKDSTIPRMQERLTPYNRYFLQLSNFCGILRSTPNCRNLKCKILYERNVQCQDKSSKHVHVLMCRYLIVVY